MTPLHIAIATARAARRWPAALPPSPQPPEPTLVLAPEPVAEPAPAPAPPMLTIRFIQVVVAEHYRMPVASLVSHCKRLQFVYPRQLAMYLSKKLVRKSYPEIARLFGGWDHTTVLHAYRASEKRIQLDEKFAEAARTLEAKIMEGRDAP